MTTFRDIWLRLLALLFPGRAERDLRDELDFHTEMRIRRNVQRGMSPAEARQEAQRAFGPRMLAADACRDERRVGLIEHLRRDVRFAWRSLVKHPGFTSVAVLTLALGIGANTALFSVADPLLTRPLPARAPDELVLIRMVGSPVLPDARALAPSLLFQEIESGSATLAGAFTTDYDDFSRRMRLWRDDASALGDVVWTNVVSHGFFRILGVTPALGRVFTEADAQPGVEPTAVISHGFWQRQYGGASDVVGRPLSLDGANAATSLTTQVTATIIGVAPRGFHGVDLDVAPDVWLTGRSADPAAVAAAAERTAPSRFTRVIARLRPGVSREQAQAETNVLLARVRPRLSERWVTPDSRIRVDSAAAGYSGLRERFRDPLLILIPAVGFVLLMACANVAALVLARAASRQKEIAVRLSLGSGRVALARLLMAESVLLATAGGAAGLLVFHWVRLAAAAYLPAESGLLAAITLDARVLAFTAGASLLSALLFGLAPAVWIARSDVGRLLREPLGQSHVSSSVATLHQAIIPLQVAFALVLLVGALLFLRTLQNLRTVDTGFDRDYLIQFTLDNRAGGQSVQEKVKALLVPEALLDRLGALPGVASITSYFGGLLQEEPRSATLRSDSVTSRREARNVSVVQVRPGFFGTLGIALVAGHEVYPEGAPPYRAVVLSEGLARHLFGRPEDAVGQTIAEDSSVLAPRRIVLGVAEDVPHLSLRDAGGWIEYQVLTPLGRLSSFSVLVLRTTVDPAQIAPAIRAAVRDLGDGYQISRMETFRDITEASIAGERLAAQVSTVFGALALTLAAVGIYGVIAYAVARRTAEIGLRMALGARVQDVILLVVRRVMVFVAGGLVLGLFGAWAAARFTSSLLFGVAPSDPATLATSLVVLTIVAAGAAYLPARRAARRIDPIAALRSE